MRFNELSIYLELNSKIKVIIGGNGNTSFLAKEGGNAETQFKNKKYPGDYNDYLAVKNYLDSTIQELKTFFSKRVTFELTIESIFESIIERLNQSILERLNQSLDQELVQLLSQSSTLRRYQSSSLKLISH